MDQSPNCLHSGYILSLMSYQTLLSDQESRFTRPGAIFKPWVVGSIPTALTIKGLFTGNMFPL
jgi:hypothetical protein